MHLVLKMAVSQPQEGGIPIHSSEVPFQFPCQLPPVKMDVGVKQHLLKVLEPSLASLKERHLFLQHLLSQLAIPPPMTTVRVNTLKYSLQEARVGLGQILQQKYKLRACAAPPAVPHPTLNDVLVIPNQFSGGVVSPAHKEVIVGIQCAEAVLRGADVFAPGVMATPKDIKVGDSVAVFGDVEGKCCKGRCERFDGEKIFVGNGQFVMERLDVFKRDPSTIRGVAVEMTHPLVDCPSLGSDDLQDLGLLQNLPSIVTAHVLDPQPGEVVLDMCAAPGGKTSHIASLMRNQGCVVALDKSPPKVSKLSENIKRFALSNVHCYLFNSTKCLDTELSNDQPFPHAPPFPPATFDRVLLDGPCSALGQRPQMKCSLSLEELKSFQSFQRKFISQAVQLLKPGGVLVFSTCTFTPEENESQVEWLLSNYPYMKLVEQEPYLGTSGWHGYNLPGVHKVQRFGPSLLSSVERQPVSGPPFHQSGSRVKVGTDAGVMNEEKLTELCRDTIGFFIAKFKKNLQ